MGAAGRRRVAWPVVFLLVLAVAGCGGGGRSGGPARLPRSYVPLPFGRGAAYRPAALSVDVALARDVRGMRCSARALPRFGVHLELFDRRRVIAIPAGIGVAPPRLVQGAYVHGGRCSYPLRTVESTGVVQTAAGGARTLGDLFAVWGKALSGQRLLSFTGPVSAFVAGRAWRSDPRAIPLARHAQIVLEVGGWVAPHTVYRFAAGL